MSQTIALPSRKDEAWRYSDLEAVAALWPVPAAQDIRLAPGESRADILVADEGIRNIAIALEAGARQELHILMLSERFSRIAITVTLGEGAHLELGAVMLAGGEATAEIVTTVRHEGVGGSSRQIVRAIAAGNATANFLGRIEVAEGAQQTDAGQGVRGLLLNRGATINAKPELEIFADDVKCAHGCAIGALDETAAFYMAARGLPPETARRLLMAAFIADSFTSIAGDDVRDGITAQAIAALEGLA